MLISAAGLIALYLGLELMSLALYVIAAFHRDNIRASEAGLKYFVLGALSSGMLLYGASLLYGFAGTVSFAGIAETIDGKASLGAVFGLVFLMAGLAFKMSAVPFHMWTPDVYEGAPTPVTAFFASAVKMAAVAITLRVVITAFPGIASQWQQIVDFHLPPVDGARRLRRDRPGQHQAPHGLFRDRPYRLRARRSRGGRRSWGQRRPRLYGDLSRHDAWHLRRDPFDARQRRRASKIFPIFPVLPKPTA